MKTSMNKLSATIVSITIIAIALMAFASSCSKSDNNTSFTGTYYGTLTTGILTEADTVVISTGSSSSDIIMTSRTDRGSTYSINGTVSGNQLNIPSQQVYIANLGATYTTTGSGTLNNSSITISYTFESSSQSYTHLTFTGTKQ